MWGGGVSEGGAGVGEGGGGLWEEVEDSGRGRIRRGVIWWRTGVDGGGGFESEWGGVSITENGADDTARCTRRRHHRGETAAVIGRYDESAGAGRGGGRLAMLGRGAD